MARFSFEAFPRALDSNGDPVSGAKLYVYVAGTTTAVTTYSDADLSTPQASPVISDAAGFFPEVYTPDGSYKVRITDADDAVIFEADDVSQGVNNTRKYSTVADLIIATTVQVGDIVKTRGYSAPGDGGGAVYEIVAAGTGTADGGEYHDLTGITGQAKLRTSWLATPMMFGASGDGVTDDAAAVKAWASYVVATYAGPGNFIVPRPVYDLGGRIYGVSETIEIPSAIRGAIVQNGSLCAVAGGVGFDNGTYDALAGKLTGGYIGWKDPVLRVLSAYATVENIGVFGNDIANTVEMQGGRAAVNGCIFRRYPNFGFWQPDGTGPGTRLSKCTIQQFNPSNDDVSDESVFTAIGVLYENSDSKIHDCDISWNLKNYVQTGGGIYTMDGCHLYGGTTARTNSTLIEIQGALSGTLVCSDTYLDNGRVTLYRDRCTFNDCVYLLDNTNVTQDAMFYLHCADATQNGIVPRIEINGGHFTEYDPDELVKLVDEAPNAWAAEAADLADHLNSVVADGNHQESHLSWFRNIVTAVHAIGDYVQQYRSSHDRAMISFKDTAQTGATVAIGSAGDTLWARLNSAGSFVVARILGTPLFMVDANTGYAGFGTDNPDGNLHVVNGSAGSVTANSNANQIVVEDANNAGISILSPDASASAVYFGSPADNLGARVQWEYSDNKFRVGASTPGGKTVLESGNASAVIELDENGVFRFLNIPTSSAGLPAGSVWSDNGTLKIT